MRQLFKRDVTVHMANGNIVFAQEIVKFYRSPKGEGMVILGGASVHTDVDTLPSLYRRLYLPTSECVVY